MHKIIEVTELQRNFRAVFDEVVRQKTPYVLTCGSRPEAVTISYKEWVRLAQAQEINVIQQSDRALERMAKLNAKFSDEEIEADLRHATKTARIRKRRS